MLNNVIHISDTEFLELRDIIHKNSAIAFSDTKKYLIENRLSKRLGELNFNAFKDYIYYLKYDANKRKEMETLINLVTINETYFLRERSQLDHMVKITLPDMIAAGKRNLRIWSAACSTGEEPYSMAILMKEAGLLNKAKIEIVATDINSRVVEFAKEGIYKSMSFRAAPANFISGNFTQVGGDYKLNDDIKAMVKFNVGNLTSPTIAAQVGRFDVVFCRNVLIYFDVDGKRNTVDMFHKVLGEDGVLYLGHSESIATFYDKFKVKNFGSGLVHVKNK